MMIYIRTFIFYTLFYVMTSIGYFVFSPLLFLPRTVHMWVPFLWTKASCFLLRVICGIKEEIRGKENLPEGPFIIACKHQSAWETLSFNYIVPETCFVTKKELLNIPFFGWFLRANNMIPLDRGKGVSSMKNLIKDARLQLENGRYIMIFPEGTRTQPGERIPYKRGIQNLWSNLKVPVVPVALNSGLFWNAKSRLKKPGTIIVEFLPPLSKDHDPKTFMKDLEERIEETSLKLIKNK